jgi:hypothetical protein
MPGSVPPGTRLVNVDTLNRLRRESTDTRELGTIVGNPALAARLEGWSDAVDYALALIEDTP